MPYQTRCTCTETQLAHVGCDCEMNGPLRTVLTFEDEREAEAAAALAAEIARQEAEAAYWAKFQAEEMAEDEFTDPREDYAEYTLAAIRHM